MFEINSRDDHMSCKGEEPQQQHTTTNSEEIASKSNSYEFINILNEDSKGEGKKQRKQRSDKNKRRKHPHRIFKSGDLEDAQRVQVMKSLGLVIEESEEQP